MVNSEALGCPPGGGHSSFLGSFTPASTASGDRIEQLELTLADIDEMLADTSGPEDIAATASDEQSADTRKPARRPLPAALPREVVEQAAPGACPGCGGALRPLDEDVTEILDFVPGSFRVIRHVRQRAGSTAMSLQRDRCLVPDRAMRSFCCVDISLDTFSICVIDYRGVIIEEGSCGSEPEAIARFVLHRGRKIQHIGLETGELSL